MISQDDALNNLKDRLLDENDALITRFSILHQQIGQLKASDQNPGDDIGNIVSTLDSHVEDLIQHVSELNNTLTNYD